MITWLLTWQLQSLGVKSHVEADVWVDGRNSSRFLTPLEEARARLPLTQGGGGGPGVTGGPRVSRALRPQAVRPAKNTDARCWSGAELQNKSTEEQEGAVVPTDACSPVVAGSAALKHVLFLRRRHIGPQLRRLFRPEARRAGRSRSRASVPPPSSGTGASPPASGLFGGAAGEP